MALIKCPQCGKEISDKAVSCPACGFEPGGAGTAVPEAQQEKPDMVICRECGTKFEKGTKACPNCGYPAEDVPQAIQKGNGEIPFFTGAGAKSRPPKQQNILVPCLIAGVCIAVLAFTLGNRSAKQDPSAVTTNAGDDIQEDDAAKTKTSLQPYLAVLGSTLEGYDPSDPSTLEVSATKSFVDNLSKVYVMGYEGTIEHSLSRDSETTIDIMSWESNETATPQEFEQFLQRMNEAYELVVGPIETANADETYSWADYENLCIIYGWHKDDKIQLMWKLDPDYINGLRGTKQEQANKTDSAAASKGTAKSSDSFFSPDAKVSSNVFTLPEEISSAKSATTGEKNALERAKKYLDYSAFSYSGLIDQLEYEGYTNQEATYAADNCGADWNVQAEKRAEKYMEYSSFSRSGLIDQLEYEGFTHSQAVHGAESVGY